MRCVLYGMKPGVLCGPLVLARGVFTAWRAQGAVGVGEGGIISRGYGSLFAVVAPLCLLVDVGLARCRHWQSTPDGDTITVCTWPTGFSF